METVYLLTKFIVVLGIGFLVWQWITITQNSIEYIARQEPVVETHIIQMCEGNILQEYIESRKIVDWKHLPAKDF